MNPPSNGQKLSERLSSLSLVPPPPVASTLFSADGMPP